MTYEEADTKLQGRCRQRRKLSRSCWLWRGTDNLIFLKMHQTNILMFEPNGDITVNIGRWFTITTKQRLNEYLPGGYRIWSVKGEWILHQWTYPVARFQNGMTIKWEGRVVGAQLWHEWQEECRQRLHIVRSEAAKQAATTRKQAKKTWDEIGREAYYA